jgi:quinol monooxygenase YgiN
VIIVAGKLYVPAEHRDSYVEDCLPVVIAARRAVGCLDFQISADPVEPGRVNVLELWATAGDVEAFRGDGPSGEQQASIESAEVYQHEVATSIRL